MDLGRAESTLRDASTLWISDFLDVYENDVQLPKPQLVAVRASLQSDRSFTSYDDALAHVTGPPLPPDAEFVWAQGLLDVLFEYPIQSDRSTFSVEPRLARLGIRTLTVMRFMPPGGAVRAFEFYGDPGLVRLDPSWFQASWQFVKLGFFHILDGTDHLLFLACLVIPFRRFRSLIAVVTAFTVAHSIRARRTLSFLRVHRKVHSNRREYRHPGGRREKCSLRPLRTPRAQRYVGAGS
ncbi:MAG: HupE/UreJ family protein [Acidobacteria bacterium]|nr:HupE/UreJ family protein [Acidobacteriota bacterium]